LVIAGEGPLRQELEALVVQLDLRSAVTFAGFLNQNELRDLF
jgi:glycosyltransferase involved in cell wall biosynthesis